jgi:hypothetical protein
MTELCIENRKTWSSIRPHLKSERVKAALCELLLMVGVGCHLLQRKGCRSCNLDERAGAVSHNLTERHSQCLRRRSGKASTKAREDQHFHLIVTERCFKDSDFRASFAFLILLLIAREPESSGAPVSPAKLSRSGVCKSWNRVRIMVTSLMAAPRQIRDQF